MKPGTSSSTSAGSSSTTIRRSPSDGLSRIRGSADGFSPASARTNGTSKQDRGRTWLEAEKELIALYPDHAELIRAFRRHWPEMVPYAYDDSVEILTSLIDQGHDVTLLTNFASDTFKEARKKFPFLNLARGITVSAEVGLIKPQREIYDLHASSFGLDPQATLFIDDNRANVEGARAAGWRALQFLSADQLRKDLEAVGICL